MQGAALSAACATLGSLAAFQLSRTLLRERVAGAMVSQPVARALAKVVEREGFKTVFVLRLAPIIPLLPHSMDAILGAPVPFIAVAMSAGASSFGAPK